MIYKKIFLAVLLSFTFLAGDLMAGTKGAEHKQTSSSTTNGGDITQPSHIVISKETMTLKLYDVEGKIIYDFPVAVGVNYGNKQKPGDKKTPEGVFEIQQIQNASNWMHDFRDGKGAIAHAYGDWFIRLYAPPHKGIGIHGTHDPNSIGKRVTEGCIRLHNHNLNKLKPLVRVGMKVIIETSKKDMKADGITISETPAVQEVQEVIKHDSTPTNGDIKQTNEAPNIEEEKNENSNSPYRKIMGIFTL